MASINTLLTKQPGESRLLSMDFSKKMSKGETITTIDSTVSNPAGLTFPSTTPSGQDAGILISGGDNHKKYKVTVTVTTSLSQILENDGYLDVKEL